MEEILSPKKFGFSKEREKTPLDAFEPSAFRSTSKRDKFK